jgi:hypothetical protein
MASNTWKAASPATSAWGRTQRYPPNEAKSHQPSIHGLLPTPQLPQRVEIYTPTSDGDSLWFTSSWQGSICLSQPRWGPSCCCCLCEKKKCAFSLPQGKFQQKDIKSHLLKSGNDLLLWLVHTYVSSLDGRFLDISCLTLVFESWRMNKLFAFKSMFTPFSLF